MMTDELGLLFDDIVDELYSRGMDTKALNSFEYMLGADTDISLVADTLVKVRKPILLMKQLAQFLVSNKGLKGTAQYADKASEFWLQYRYGFLPLYLTVQDVIKQFNRDVKVWTRTASSIVKRRGY